jgi:hypothetical protein
MIIEAGYDLTTLMFDGKFDAGALRVISLDGDFRVVGCRAARGDFGGDLASASLEAIDDAVPDHDEDDEFAARYAVQFVALGYEVSKVDGHIESLDCERYRVIREWFDCRGIDVLGIYIFDGTYWASTGPMKTFSTYAGAENYPRTLTVRGPHPFLTCECAVCGPERARLGEARAKRIAREEAV